MSKNTHIVIAGAGLVGSLLALVLKRRGFTVSLYEKRPDMRLINNVEARSINLILTAKGLHTLKEANLLEEVMPLTTPVTGRMIHSMDGHKNFQRYGRDDSECNYSVSRAELNKKLLTLAENVGVQTYFDCPLNSIDFKNKQASFQNYPTLSYDLFLGADGGGSVTRHQLIKYLGAPAHEDLNPLGTDYKELLMPAKNGNYALEKNALHIWPRGSHFLMALPNLDGSFTMTIYLPPSMFQELKTPESVTHFFEQYYADSIPLMPHYVEEFLKHPQGFLGTVRCDPWNYQDSVLLFGDAAHAIVPFFGQGMNCGFTDVHCFTSLLDTYPNDWQKIFTHYYQTQKENADAIADLSLENYVEMQDKVGQEKFLLRKTVEARLEKEFPHIYRSRYGMVTYTLIPYSLAKKIGPIQNEILDQLCENISEASQLDLELAQGLIKANMVPFLKEHHISLERYQI